MSECFFETLVSHFAYTDHGASVNCKDKSGHTPLHYASVNNRVKPVQRLLDLGADVNAKNMLGENAIMHTTSVEVARNLLERGAQVGDYIKSNALHKCASHQSAELLKVMLEAGVKSNKGTTSRSLLPISSLVINHLL